MWLFVVCCCVCVFVVGWPIVCLIDWLSVRRFARPLERVRVCLCVLLLCLMRCGRFVGGLLLFRSVSDVARSCFVR